MSQLSCAIIQLNTGFDLEATVKRLRDMMERLPEGGLAVAPEGTLSGYVNAPSLIKRLNSEATQCALENTQRIVDRTGVSLVVGACVQDEGHWRNRSFLLQPNKPSQHYDKVNLAVSEQGIFKSGEALPVFDVQTRAGAIRLGIQMCREIRYPEQWRILATKGAQIIAYPNNAIDSSTGDAVWRAHLISRAAETQRFVLGANAASDTQLCPSAILSPKGGVIAQTHPEEIGVATASINLSEVSNWVIDQARTDLITGMMKVEPGSGSG
ncbi:carbon-nitrogen hydrolase family protein [Oceanicaulis sp.]|jgi:predicted amidohydrolase|uniref:carbon-nitrogen hydrolase family protein n=1 Tax=Oceanicaulis sp. TaxID=1924941 RepID=UPI000D307F94